MHANDAQQGNKGVRATPGEDAGVLLICIYVKGLYNAFLEPCLRVLAAALSVQSLLFGSHGALVVRLFAAPAPLPLLRAFLASFSLGMQFSNGF